MNVTIPKSIDLKKVCVKILCVGVNSVDEGSGTLIFLKNELYVLTAAHVIKDDKTGIPYDNHCIKISITRNSRDFNFTVKKQVLYNEDTDAAVLLVSNDGNMPTRGLDRVRILSHDVAGVAKLCGYHKGQQALYYYNVVNRADGIWATDFELKLQSSTATENFKGCSGGGVFFKDNDGFLYLAGYMQGIASHSGNNNEIGCPTAMKYCEFNEICAIVDDRQYNYISDPGVASDIDGKESIKPLDKSSYSENHQWPFIPCEKLFDIIEKLKDDDEKTILLTALSGMGKSRLIYEAFKETERKPNRYYAKFDENRSDIRGELATILMANYDQDGIVIIDDCPMDFIPQLINTRNRTNEQFRLIFANHDYFSEELEYKKDYTVILLSPDDIKEDVNKFISEAIGENETNKSDIEEIKKLAGGFPQMAVELVEAYQKEHAAGPEVVRHLMPKLLDLSKGYENEEKKVWQTLSLCMPFPYHDASHDGFKYLLLKNQVTPLGAMDFSERRSIVGKIINKYQPTLIDVVGGHWLYVRPFPLAVWLTAEWFANVCNTSQHFKELIEDIQSQPEWVQNSISEGFCKHIQQMSGDKTAFEMVSKLVNSNVNDPFFNEETLCSGLGSKFLLAMSTVNPAVICSVLLRTLGTKGIEWLRNEFNGDGRRNVVWALEKLCFAAESYHEAIMVLARLAIAENEDIGNNATGQLIQLFHIHLAGTEVGLADRLWALEQLMGKGDEYHEILVKCFGSAFRNGGFTKMGGAEKFGFKNRKDYTPKDRKEIFDYWEGCKELLLRWLNEKPEVASIVSEMIEDNTFQWVRRGNWKIFVPLLEKVATIRDYRWDKEYDALARVINTFSIDPKLFGIDEIMTKLRSSSFITRIKEARYQLYGKQYLKEEDSQILSLELFEPLAEVFLRERIHENSEEVKAILEDNEYISIYFVRKVVELLTEEDLSKLFLIIIGILREEPEGFYSPFLGNLCYEARERQAYKEFLLKLKEERNEILYVSLMGSTEDWKLSHFYQLLAEQREGQLHFDFLMIYLQRYRANDDSQFLKMLRTLRQAYPDRPNALIAYFLSERFMMKKNEDSEVVAIVKDTMLEYHVDENHGRMMADFTRILVETLQNWRDVDFAKKINKKMISVYNSQMVHLSCEGIFTELLKDYLEEIWPDFVSALLAPESFLFYYQVKDEIGSGFGFGKGPFFDIDENLIKNLCFEYPESGPNRIASMAPCFEEVPEDEEVQNFSKWFLWLLNNFGEQKEVRDSISANIGSFYWEGTTINYYKRNIRCFEKLLDHNNPAVVNWAEKNIADNKKLLEAEESNEEFMHIRYRL